MRDTASQETVESRSAADDAASDAEASRIRDSLEGQSVCPFCGIVSDGSQAVCAKCTMENSAVARKATKSRIGPWYVLQSRNPAAPGMKWETLLSFVRKGRIKPNSIVRGPTTHQLWRFAAHVKGLSREFGVCYSCGGSVEHDGNLCAHCNRLQEPPVDPDTLLEGGEGEGRRAVFQEVSADASGHVASIDSAIPPAVEDEIRRLREEAEAFAREQREAIAREKQEIERDKQLAAQEREAFEREQQRIAREREAFDLEQLRIAEERDAALLAKDGIERQRDELEQQRQSMLRERDELMAGPAQEREAVAREQERVAREREAAAAEKEALERQRQALERDRENLRREREIAMAQPAQAREAIQREQERIARENAAAQAEKEAIDEERAALNRERENLRRERETLLAQPAQMRESLAREQEHIAREREAAAAEKELLRRERDVLDREREALRREREAESLRHEREAESLRRERDAAAAPPTPRESAAPSRDAAAPPAREPAAPTARDSAGPSRESATPPPPPRTTRPAAQDDTVWDLPEHDAPRTTPPQPPRDPRYAADRAVSAAFGGSRPRQTGRDGFLSAKDLAAAFKLNLAPSAEYDIGVPRDEPQVAPPPAPVFPLTEPPSRRGKGHLVALFIVLGLIAFGVMVAVRPDWRDKAIKMWNEFTTDSSTKPPLPKASPATTPEKDDLSTLTDPDHPPAIPAPIVPTPQTQPAGRSPENLAPPSPPAPSAAPPSPSPAPRPVPATPAPGPTVATPPAATAPPATPAPAPAAAADRSPAVAPRVPAPTPSPAPAPAAPTPSAAEQAQILYRRAKDAEVRRDFAEAARLFEEIKKLPRNVWPDDDIEGRAKLNHIQATQSQ